MMLSRRTLVFSAGAAAAAQWLAASAFAQAASAGAELPLRTTGLEHLGLLVPDVERAGRFYGRVFNPELHKEREPPLRYYVTLGAGYIALGAAGERPTQIDHYCALVDGYDPRAFGELARARGLSVGRFGMLADSDGLALQLLRVPGGLAASTEPAGRISADTALVTPLGLEHVVLRVSDIERALPFYRMFFGAETTRTASSGPVWFQVARTRLGLVSAAAGEPPRIDHFCVRVEAFDAGAVTAGLSALGAQVHSSGNEAGVTLRFTDPDGISVELQAG